MTTYDVVLHWFVFGGNDESFSIQMTKRMQLPFMPTCDISLGLCEHSEFNCDDYSITRVMWHTHNKEFHVEIKELRGYPREYVKWLVDDGWFVDPGVRFTELAHAIESTLEDSEYDETVVYINGGYYTLTQDELATMRLTGQPFRIVELPQKKGNSK